MKQLQSIFIEGLENYIDQELIERPDSKFNEIENFAEIHSVPILSPASGAVLRHLIEINHPKRILELGTGLGYSAAWMLDTKLDFSLVTIDRNVEMSMKAKEFIESIKQPNQTIEFIHSHILDKLKQMENLESFDLIFIDCDKICYPEILDIFLKQVSKNLILIFDNVLWHGRLLDKHSVRPSDQAVQKFWTKIKESKIKQTLFPVGDGILYLEKFVSSKN